MPIFRDVHLAPRSQVRIRALAEIAGVEVTAAVYPHLAYDLLPNVPDLSSALVPTGWRVILMEGSEAQAIAMFPLRRGWQALSNLLGSSQVLRNRAYPRPPGYPASASVSVVSRGPLASFLYAMFEELSESGSAFEQTAAVIDRPELCEVALWLHPDRADERPLRNFGDPTDDPVIVFAHDGGDAMRLTLGRWAAYTDGLGTGFGELA